MRILIVEDDVPGQRLLKRCLSGYAECDIAANGIEAVDAFNAATQEKRPYDLICLDIMMLHMNGHEALAAIRAAENALGIGGHDGVEVLLVGYVGQTGRVTESLREGCEVYLVKPVEKAKLYEQIEKLGLALSEVK